MSVSTTEWLAALQGHPFDVEYCRRLLKTPFDPSCENFALGDVPTLCLRSARFHGFETPEDVKPTAEVLIARLNGAMRIHSQTEPLTIKGIGKLDDAGQLHVTSFMEGRATARSMATGTLEAHYSDGTRVPSAASIESDVQRWLRAAETKDEVADLLLFAGRADNWIDVFNAYEAAKHVIAKPQKELHALMGNEASEVDLMRQTANLYRHARERSPAKPMPFATAMELLPRLLRATLSHIGL